MKHKFVLGMTVLGVAAGLSMAIPSHAQENNTAPRDIYIQGEINEVAAYLFKKDLEKLNASGSGEITVHITSYGGSVYSGIQMYDYMEESLSPIKTVCEGFCMSMAAVLLAVGDVRESQEHATIMFHEASFEAGGKVSAVIKETEEVQRLQAIMNGAVMKRSGLSAAEITKMESYDHFMSPEEAKSLGLIDVVRTRARK